MLTEPENASWLANESVQMWVPIGVVPCTRNVANTILMVAAGGRLFAAWCVWFV